MYIYTDGATSGNGYDSARGGWAYIIVNDYDQIIFSDSNYITDHPTNNICELTAVINGCIRVKDIDGPHLILSDSSYIINCYKDGWYKKWIKNGWINSKKDPVANRELWEQLIPFFENSEFDFKKVKGHNGNFYNEMVDKLAVEARQRGE